MSFIKKTLQINKKLMCQSIFYKMKLLFLVFSYQTTADSNNVIVLFAVFSFALMPKGKVN